MRKLSFLFALTVTLGFLSSAAFSNPNSREPLQTVSSVDINQYLGKWYEIASIPQRFQKGCAASSAEYSFLML